ncbi:MAG: lysophospholipid acyltransferase family protein [Bacteroidales bacterium]|nr:lysophospholipid acyltransferase family protein [Bacteroidales bacterium]MCF8388769.1 lysophospholipid acyltransferase family protein [Bacteroidales bacterium]MCF8396867.1 lysophospholipid acyltransferase family protein [Bacteroidales bacterium]
MRIVYFIFNIVAWFISILPFGILYLLSDFLYFVIYYLIQYRRKTVYTNLKRAFPGKSKKEIKSIVKQYYRNLSDIILETLKIRNFSEKELDRRIIFNNYEILEKYFKEGRSVFVAAGHCGNWEWLGIALARITNFHPYAIYKQLNDPYFEKYMSMLRTKSGYNNLIRFKQTFRTLARLRDKQNIVIIVGDQTPTKVEINYWTKFFGRETGFFLGLEKMSKALDYVVVFFDMHRVKRGYYEIDILLLEDDPKRTEEYEITEKYVRYLEAIIRKNPDNWLWSHRRWKHQKPKTES